MMKETLQAAEIKERVNSWLAAYSPGEQPFDFSALDDLYWQDEQLLTFDTLSPQATHIQGWKMYESIFKPFLTEFSQEVTQLQMQPVGEIRILTGDRIAVSALIFHSTGTTPTQTNVDITAHATLIWEKREGQWRISHEHISNPVKV